MHTTDIETLQAQLDGTFGNINVHQTTCVIDTPDGPRGKGRSVNEGYFRGYPIERCGTEFLFSDTKQSVSETWLERPCGHCGLLNTEEGHDGCLGTLDGVRNACCGHGVTNDAYVQFNNCKLIQGEEASQYINSLGE